MEGRESVELVIVGAGGVWAQERLYPGLRLNNLLGTYEYSDFPMDEAFRVQPGQHISGEATHRYLRAYAEESGILLEDSLDEKGEGERRHISTQKLIMATGTFSEPFLPALKGAETFDPPLFHSKDMARMQQAITQAKSVAVLGGSKSGYDAAYLAASHGVGVDWIVNNSGRGATWIAPPYVTPLKKWLEKLVNTRFLTWFSPCSWGDADGFGGARRLLHSMAIGRWIVDRFWKVLGNDVVTLNAYEKHPETRKLKPWTDAFWAASSFSILNYPSNFYDLVREGKIRVHITDIERLSSNTVHFVNGQSIKTDALISCTGWRALPAIKFLPEGIEKQLGLPHKTLDVNKLAVKADAEILSRFPRLQRLPVVQNPYGGVLRDFSHRNDQEPFRLYRHMVPPAFIHDRSIGFAGMVTNFSITLCAQTQALWLTAYLDGRLPLETSSPTFEDDLRWDTVYHSQFGKWRYPYASPHHPDFVFDAVPYLDWLLRDLGLKVHRKKSWFAEIFEPYGPADYQGLIEEWQETLIPRAE
ncbi:predicted protein [Uncinocarpus reesii 1704]|uniref:L-ornithine N(5)-monooxygenase n=1 Tax=Uncinocarpus reesii (strain UAMH 1704) TaxID=336963 RepID=C4JZH1_UNCRE|nr:uncharacterized protein UREG_07572 [Uncinocarpus reesii 1704]EEP82707.1 predicted protein [Uncinocarpus reesii 1704]